MVKADASRNYYLDLKVSANASENEIRKAFRTLALQYHPDRNPGREAEYVVKFQEIQAAHEVLSDAGQRAKYDAERRKFRNLNLSTNPPNTPRTRPPPPSRNVYTTTPTNGSYYRAPPPKPAAQPSKPSTSRHHDNFNTDADRFTSRTFRPPPTAQRPNTRAKEADDKTSAFTAWQKMKASHADETRKQDPSTGGPSSASSQYHPNGVPFGRSQNTRASSKQGYDPSAPGADEGQARSAYRSHVRPATSPSKAADSPYNPSQSTKDVPVHDVPFSEANRVRTPYCLNAPGQRTSMFDGLGRSASVRNSPTPSYRSSPLQDDGAFSDSGRRQQRSSSDAKPTQTFPQMYSDSSDEDSDREKEIPTDVRHRRPRPSSFSPPFPKSNAPSTAAWSHQDTETSQQRRKSDTMTENVPKLFKRAGEERVNMKFSPSDWHGEFQGGADYFAPNVHKDFHSRGRSLPAKGRPSQKTADHSAPPPSSAQPFLRPFPIPPPPPMPPPPSRPPPQRRSSNASFPPPLGAGVHTTKFSQEIWAETFKDPQMFFPDKKETSPRRTPEVTKRPKMVRKQSTLPNNSSSSSSSNNNNNAKTQDDSRTARSKFQAFVQEANSEDADAMDVDSNTPSTPKPTSNGRYAAQPSSTLNASMGSHAMFKDSTAAQTSTTTKPSAHDLHDISGLGNVEPFLPLQNTGLGLNNLKDTLPFPSQPASSYSTKSNMAQKLKYPSMPGAPLPPAKLDQVSTYQYFNRMESYVKAYQQFSKSLSGHFVARNAELESMDDHFINHRGESMTKPGFASYLAKAREDEEVMETWKLAQERHIQALEQCEKVRNKAIKMYHTLQT